MKACLFLIALAIGAAQAAGDRSRGTPRAAAPKPKVTDLDLTQDFAEEEEAPPRPAAPAISASHSHPWIYWALGATVTAGGVGWYLHESQKKESAVTRNEQVFTDDR
jgi:hypothetical protein